MTKKQISNMKANAAKTVSLNKTSQGTTTKKTTPAKKTLPAPAAIASSQANPITAPVLDGTVTVTEAYKVDVHKGSVDGRLSEQWYTRPHDQRFTSMDILGAFLKQRKDATSNRLVKISDLAVESHNGSLMVSDGTDAHRPTHYSFDQLCAMVPAPKELLRDLTPSTASLVIRERMAKTRPSDDVRLVSVSKPTGDSELRTFTSPTYGRIDDYDMYNLIRRLTDHDPRWKIPGMIDWAAGKHNPYVDITKDNTTLYASDRDSFGFLCDDTRPIEAGKLPNGDPDLYFRGFYWWNGEDTDAGMACFYLRGVCQNRNLWGQEGFQTIRVRHSKNSMSNFIQRATGPLMTFTESSTTAFEDKVNRARQLLIASTDEERVEFLLGHKFKPDTAQEIIRIVAEEEDRPMENLYDAVQGITALARRKDYQNERLNLEKKGTELFELAA